MNRVINFNLPKDWQELTDEQLMTVYSLLALNVTDTELKMYCFVKWCNIEIVARIKDHNTMIKYAGEVLTISTIKIVEILSALDWLLTIPSYPIRPNKIGKYTAIANDFQGVEFGKYIFCDNLYQGILNSEETGNTEQRSMLCRQMAEILYDTPQDSKLITPEYEIAIFYWFSSLKLLFSQTFVHFLQPATQPTDNNLLSCDISKQLTDAMNAQIRALTKGDVTKEKEILKIDTWRALTELDAIAKESEEINRKYGKH